MSFKPIQLQELSLTFPHKTCFENFTAQIPYGSRIAIIGRNGAGKSTLLKMLQGDITPSSGEIKIPGGMTVGYVPQVITTHTDLSGGQRFNQALTQALAQHPDLLLLDEPTNHLDLHNRKSLLRMLRAFTGTLLVVSHDVELLRSCIDTIWHIDNGMITLFHGNYDDYLCEINHKRTATQEALEQLHRQKQELHQALMHEQNRAAKSRQHGEKSIAKHKWPTIVSKAKAARATATAGQKRAAITHSQEELRNKLNALHLPEIIVPKFTLSSADVGSRSLLTIREGSVGYKSNFPILSNISFTLMSDERIAIQGDNGSGKSTLVKAILADPNVQYSGEWYVPKSQEIGYLDQHYTTIDPNKSVLEVIQELVPSWSHAEIRRHLNDFLFRKNEEVNAMVQTLSGGEKVRLVLAQIAAKTPRLLILDEITNNIDLETREHIIQVLQHYPGAMMVISHDEDFLAAIWIQEYYIIAAGTINHSKIM